MSASAAAKVKNLEVCYFERKDLVDKKPETFKDTSSYSKEKT